MRLDKEICEKIVFDHDFQSEIIAEALTIVKKFIAKNDRILVGGMAIDFALRAKKSFLYPDDKLPDYDFISPDFHMDAYDLGNELAKKFDRVQIINALHTSTMKVRVNYVVVADITYVPKNLYALMPTLTYQGIRYIHPHYQMIDQHRALATPYENPPRETILGKRWPNDIARYELLNKNYEIVADGTVVKNIEKMNNNKEAADGNKNEVETDSAQTKNAPATMSEYTIDYSFLDSQCISGYLGYIYWAQRAKEFGYIDVLQIGELTFGTDSIHVKIPANLPISILSDDFAELLKKINQKNIKNVGVTGGGKRAKPTRKAKSSPRAKPKPKPKSARKATDQVKYYNAILDKIPRRCVHKNVEIIDNRGILTGCFQPMPNKRIFVGNIQHICTYLLTIAIFNKDEFARALYVSTRNILYWAAEKYNGENLTSSEDEKIAKYKYEEFLPTYNVYGAYNWSESYILAREELLHNINPREELRLMMQLRKPKRAFLAIKEIVPESLYLFEPSNSPIYQFDGSECGPFKTRELQT